MDWQAVTDTDRTRTRRRLLQAGGALAGLASSGCLRLTGGEAATTNRGAPTNGSTTTGAASTTASDDGSASTTDAEADGETETGTDEGTTSGEAVAGLELVVRHALDGSYADSTNDVDGRPAASGLAFVDDQRGTVLDFRGRGAGSKAGYYDLPYDALDRHFDVGDPVTTAFWLAPAALDDWYATFSGTGVAVGLRGGDLRLSRFNTQTRSTDYGTSVPADSVLDAGSWTHLVGTVEPGAEARLFVDGTGVATTGVDADQGYQPKQPSDIDAARVGFPPSGDDGAYDAHLDGRLDDLRLYRGSVDEAGAEALYDAMR